MRFVDEAFIEVQAGRGGNGCVSFRRERHLPKGGPDGGDGGRGGSIFLKVDSRLHTLYDIAKRTLYKAQSGFPGAGRQRAGKAGKDTTLNLPLGTQVYDAASGRLLYALMEPNQTFCVAEGGQAGLGNLRFKSSTNRTPYQSTQGVDGENFKLKLVLSLLAQVGLLGLPNAGKSTFIQAVSHSKSKVGSYPFTTLQPALGVVNLDAYRYFVMADIPGVIAGASQGLGLGSRFLKHISRCEILLHLVDLSQDISDCLHAVRIILEELEAFDPKLLKKKRYTVFTKLDLLSEEEKQEKVAYMKQVLGLNSSYCYGVSALHKQGTKKLCDALYAALFTDSFDQNIAN